MTSHMKAALKKVWLLALALAVVSSLCFVGWRCATHLTAWPALSGLLPEARSATLAPALQAAPLGPQRLTTTGQTPEQTPAGLASSDWASIRAAHQTRQHSFQPLADGHYTARNPGQQCMSSSKTSTRAGSRRAARPGRRDSSVRLLK